MIGKCQDPYYLGEYVFNISIKKLEKKIICTYVVNVALDLFKNQECSKTSSTLLKVKWNRTL